MVRDTPQESKVVLVRFKSRKLQVKGRLNNTILAANARKVFYIPVEEYKGLTQIL